MADQPFEPATDPRLRDFLAGELRQAELDFPRLPRPEPLPAQRRHLSLGVLAAAVVILSFVVVGSLYFRGPSGLAGGTPLGADGLPVSIDGEPVVRGAQIGLQPTGDSFLAGGTLMLDTSPCLPGSARAQLGCVEGWRLVDGPIADPSSAFVLDIFADAPGFVRTSGALTVARVHAWTSASGEVSREILMVEAIAWRQPTKGPIPRGGDITDALVPDFVSALGRDGVSIAGYVPKGYLFEPFEITPGNPSNPPQSEPQPVYGEDLTTLVGHMMPGVGFVALGSEESPAPTASVMPPSVGPSVAPTVPADGVDCGRISSDACAEAIALARAIARAGQETDVSRATVIAVDDTCPPPSICDRKYPFDSIVVFAAGGDTTGWYAFHVYGLQPDAPTTAERWWDEIPAHVVQRIRELLPTP
jgi:hypothetical protein